MSETLACEKLESRGGFILVHNQAKRTISLMLIARIKLFLDSLLNEAYD